MPLLAETDVSTNAANLSPVIRLSASRADGKVLVHTDSNDKFLLTMEEAVKACRAWNHLAEFHRQMDELMGKLSEWVRENAHRAKEAYLGVKPSGLLFLVVMSGKKFDESLEDSLTDLDIEVANSRDFSHLRLDVMAIPDGPRDCIDSFMRA